MTFFIKSLSRKVTLICTVLLLSACGGSESTREAADSPAATEELQKLADNAVAQQLVVAPTGQNSNQILSAAFGRDLGLPPIADVYIGTIDVPYYFDPSNSTVSSWGASLAVRDTLTVPVMMTLPNANSGKTIPADGWPIVMYQHGITRNRTDVLAYSVAQSAAGFAVIAIDLPTHGLTDESNPFHAKNTPFPTDSEQTFGVDSRTQDSAGNTTALVPDGVIDTSGTHFINIPSLKTSRDNVRQGAANLITLRKSIGGIINVATGTSVPVDTSKVGLIAHSLGGMVATVYLGVETTPTPSSIVMAGATITDVLRNSASFGPVILRGLGGLGVTTAEGVDSFYLNAQDTVDAGEPANYAAAAAATHPIHLIEVIGDQTVPNSSTENLAQLMGASSVSTTTPGIAPGNPGIVRFTVGSHSSPLLPDAATVAIQTQLANFQGSAISPTGPVIVVGDGCIVQGGTCNSADQ